MRGHKFYKDLLDPADLCRCPETTRHSEQLPLFLRLPPLLLVLLLLPLRQRLLEEEVHRAGINDLRRGARQRRSCEEKEAAT